MKMRFSGLLLLPFLILSSAVQAKTNLNALANHAISENPKEAASAIAELRAEGPAGLEALHRAFAGEIALHVANPLLERDEKWIRISAALDGVSKQKDSYLGGLYWYTDLGQAKSAARRANKPILSLRLLGKLDEEFSCANSRFFRTILYSNAEVSRVLRERFILHWESVRPVPRVVIDFGDGRKLERTLTGNSIHYVLNFDGQPLDALPGLYGPQAFLRELKPAEDVFAQLATRVVQPAQLLSSFHSARLNAINVDWITDTEKIGGRFPVGIVVSRDQRGAPKAIEVASLAATKMVTEATLLRSLLASGDAVAAITDEAAWKKIAQLHLDDVKLDSRSVGLIRRQTKNLYSVSDTKRGFEVLLAKLESDIALDTVRNQYLLRRKLLSWMITDPARNDINALNNKVYAELFLTPASDPWLGLVSSDAYMALENGGVVKK